jgi:hypothetical protein
MDTQSLSPEVKRLGREADHSLSSSAEVKNTWSYISTYPYFFKAWWLVRHKDNLTFTLISVVIVVIIKSEVVPAL